MGKSFTAFLSDTKSRSNLMFKSEYNYNFGSNENNFISLQHLLDSGLQSSQENFYKRNLGLLPLHFFVCHYHECKQIVISRLNYLLILPASVALWSFFNILDSFASFFRNFLLKLD